MILPAAVTYLGRLSAAGPSSRGVTHMCEKVVRAGRLSSSMRSTTLEHAQHEAHEAGSVVAEAATFRDKVIPAQGRLREVADELEAHVADDLWPLPKYRELLFQY